MKRIIHLDRLAALSRAARQSITFDRGSEFMAWPMLADHVEMGRADRSR